LSEHYYSNQPTSKHDFNDITMEFGDELFKFTTDAGVFSKDRIDPGTKLLLKAIDVKEDDCFLDLGCGYGVVGVVVGKFRPKSNIYMVDINQRACDLSMKNLEGNGVSNAQVKCGDGLTVVMDVKFDCIATNPPIRAGKKEIYAMADMAYEQLKTNGRFYAVIRTSQGAASFAKQLEKTYGNVATVEVKGGYRVLCSIKG
jgi:16S RNA G1207 methylase RsmC